MTPTLPGALQRWLPRRWRRPSALPKALWRRTLAQHRFLDELSPASQQRLRLLCSHFLLEKEFHGAHGLVISDAMALAIAAQACLPLLNMGGPGERQRNPLRALDWYNDFVGIVVQPGAAVAQRERTDGSGVVHRYREVLAGEAMDGGPVMLSWQEVEQASGEGEHGRNVVIHEFAHKFDMRSGRGPHGAPPLPAGFLGMPSEEAAREHWRRTMQAAFERFTEALAMAERFGGETPWLDAYGATDPAEFFAVGCEAYFVNRSRFAIEFPELLPLFDGFFSP